MNREIIDIKVGKHCILKFISVIQNHVIYSGPLMTTLQLYSSRHQIVRIYQVCQRNVGKAMLRSLSISSCRTKGNLNTRLSVPVGYLHKSVVTSSERPRYRFEAVFKCGKGGYEDRKRWASWEVGWPAMVTRGQMAVQRIHKHCALAITDCTCRSEYHIEQYCELLFFMPLANENWNAAL